MVVKFKLYNVDTEKNVLGEATIENGKTLNLKLTNPTDGFVRYGYELAYIKDDLKRRIEEDIKYGDELLLGTIKDFPLPKMFFWEPIYIGKTLVAFNMNESFAF